MIKTKKVAFIGGGHMATAIIQGLLAAGMPANHILVCAPSAATRQRLSDRYQVATSACNCGAVAFANAIIVAVKPQLVAQVCGELAAVRLADHTVISIAAGVQHQQLGQWLGDEQRVICAMPNLPTAMQQGMTGLYCSAATAAASQQLAEQLFDAVGEAIWLSDERDMAAVVAAAGSAPAYFFRFMEAMTKAAVQQGLSAQEASRCVRQSAIGAIAMASESQVDLACLRERVTSPNGSTAAALDAFDAMDMDQVVAMAMAAAATRTRLFGQSDNAFCE
ncbi:pyrroline-5-carboxylate reductase [Neiella marina]|uniref:Pyrroline-5-carboxylate reductase n=1 Tax=Neiella marina TaxID=508461 RepID=A0A8J2XR22_9GAMM|nr:pyrroline-5-carboxylate reductase [Neiella marina]GGA87247.1 pyrroline-5-carboxylate reductase [Neiella marina]